MVNLKGGKGQKAPYETLLMRVPKPLKVTFERQLELYRSMVSSGSDPDTLLHLDVLVDEVAADHLVTRNGRDRGAVKRALDSFVQKLLTRPE